MSHYLNPNNSLQRLREEWALYDSIIVAVDFDSTLIPYKALELQADFEPIRDLVRELHNEGCTIIIFTASERNRWDDIKKQLEDMSIKYQYFNQSPPEIAGIGKEGKVYANAYLDDRAGLHQVYTELRILLAERKMSKTNNVLKKLAHQMSKY